MLKFAKGLVPEIITRAPLVDFTDAELQSFFTECSGDSQPVAVSELPGYPGRRHAQQTAVTAESLREAYNKHD